MKLGEESSTHQQMQALEAFDFLYEDTDISYDFGGLKRDSMKTNDSRDLAMTHHDESSDDEVTTPSVTATRLVCVCVLHARLTVILVMSGSRHAPFTGDSPLS